MPFLVRCAALLRLCEDNDGDNEQKGSSEENDAQCVQRLGPRERPDQSHDYSRGDENDIDENRCGVRLSPFSARIIVVLWCSYSVHESSAFRLKYANAKPFPGLFSRRATLSGSRASCPFPRPFRADFGGFYCRK